ncbi:hypothetical protein K501DRAFT_289439 [Backusella circina FSU 941]|nr:hypothetical protein K501DRAFT_289439 [Backusella circina FSU 941]
MSQLQETKGTAFSSSSQTPYTPSQDTFPSEFPGLNNFNPATIDSWLADELCRSGLISNPFEFLQDINAQQTKSLISSNNGNNQSSPSVSNSTTCLISPPNTIVSDAGSQAFSPKSSYGGGTTNQSPPISLFPDINPTSTSSAAATQSTGIASLPRIAPRPSTLVRTEVPPIPRPSKRRHDPSKDNEELMLKRQKNTDAARRSRMKKLVKMESLEQRVSDLEAENNQLNTRIAVLESEKSNLESKDKSLEERIRTLEAQLTEAHRALTRAN